MMSKATQNGTKLRHAPNGSITRMMRQPSQDELLGYSNVVASSWNLILIALEFSIVLGSESTAFDSLVGDC